MVETGSGRLVRGLGPIATVALVVGNIIGAGIYVVPGSLAAMAGPLALVAWLINLAAYFCLAAVFADLGGAYPISGGPQVYAQKAFGDLVGFEAAYLYWLSAVIGNAAYPTAFVGYLAVLVPAAAAPLPAFLVAQALLWSLTLLNIAGVEVGGKVQVLTAVLKVLPLLVVAVVLLVSGRASNLEPFAPHGWALCSRRSRSSPGFSWAPRPSRFLPRRSRARAGRFAGPRMRASASSRRSTCCSISPWCSGCQPRSGDRGALARNSGHGSWPSPATSRSTPNVSPSKNAPWLRPSDAYSFWSKAA